MNTVNIFPLLEDVKYKRLGFFDRVPANVSYLAHYPNEKMCRSTIGLKWHDRTQHLSIENFQPPKYYEDYVMTTSYSEKIQALQKRQMEILISLHEDNDQSIHSFIEVGCGDGSFLKYANKYFNRVLGIEPSRRFAEVAVRQGFEVLVGFVGTATSLTSEKFDSFASRQVFEHLPDPLDVLIGIKKMLKPGAVGLIEVPNGYRALRLKRFFEFFPDHINYYSTNSLVALASDAGFNVISCQESFGGDYLELWLRNQPDIETYFEEMIAQREQVCAEFSKKVTELSGQGKRVAVWGCGAKTLSILEACPYDMFLNIVGIIDSDPNKHGRYIPNTAIQVFSPDQGKELNSDVIFILALSYREEIAESIRKNISGCRTILTLDDRGQIVEL